MNLAKKYFPYSLKGTNLTGLIVAILIYAIINFVGGIVFSILSKLPLVGFIASFAGWALSIYCAAGGVLAVFIFFKIFQTSAFATSRLTIN